MGNAVSGHMKELVTRDDPKPPRRVRTLAGRDYYGLEIGDVITPDAAARAKARVDERREQDRKLDAFLESQGVESGAWQAPIEVSYDRLALKDYGVQSVSRGGFKYERVSKDSAGRVLVEEYVLGSDLKHLANYGGVITRPDKFVTVDVSEPLAPSVPEDLYREHESWFKRHWGVEVKTRRQRETDALIAKARNRKVEARPLERIRTSILVAAFGATVAAAIAIVANLPR